MDVDWRGLSRASRGPGVHVVGGRVAHCRDVWGGQGQACQVVVEVLLWALLRMAPVVAVGSVMASGVGAVFGAMVRPMAVSGAVGAALVARAAMAFAVVCVSVEAVAWAVMALVALVVARAAVAVALVVAVSAVMGRALVCSRHLRCQIRGWRCHIWGWLAKVAGAAAAAAAGGRVGVGAHACA